MKKFLIFILISTLTFTALFFNKKSNENKEKAIERVAPKTIQITPTPEIKTSEVLLKETKNTDIEIGGWIPQFDASNGISSVEKNKDKIKNVHYAGGSVNPEGIITYGNNFDLNLNRINNLDIAFGVNIISSQVSSTENFLNNTSNQEKFHQEIVSWKKFKNFNSVNIDFEAVSKNQSNKYIEYLNKLKSLLAKENLKLFVTVYAKSKGFENNGLKKEGINYEEIGKVADYVVIMAYDYVLLDANPRGIENANAPDFWIEEVVKYTLSKVPAEKIILGLPLYGYGYDKNTKYLTTSYTYQQIENIIKNENLTPQFVKEWNEMKIVRKTGEVIYYQTKDTLNKKKEILKSNNINKVFYWRFGSDGGIGL